MATNQNTAARTRIRCEVSGGIARIVLDHAPLNVVDIPMMEELAAAIAEVNASPEVTGIAISGQGDAFSAGVDVAAHNPDRVSTMLGGFHAVVRLLVASTKVTIAAVHGHCLGGAAELAMACDIVYTTRGARWGFPEIKLGCYPPVACAALAGLVGQKRAAELILTGRTITGEEAAAMGLATRVVEDGGLSSEVDKCGAALTSLSPAALALAKKATYAWDAIHFDKGLARAEKIYFEELMKTQDAQEGIQAFMEKRAAKWTGR